MSLPRTTELSKHFTIQLLGIGIGKITIEETITSYIKLLNKFWCAIHSQEELVQRVFPYIKQNLQKSSIVKWTYNILTAKNIDV